jgi:hypothetical protein
VTPEQYDAEMLEIYREAQANGGHTVRSYQVDPNMPITRLDTLYGFGVVNPAALPRPEFAVRLIDMPWYLRLWNYLWGRA